MADIYYKDGSSWKVLASNPFVIGTLYESINDTSPATIVGGTWRPLGGSVTVSVSNLISGITAGSFTERYNAADGYFQVYGTLTAPDTRVAVTTNSSGRFNVAKVSVLPTGSGGTCGTITVSSTATGYQEIRSLYVDSDGWIYGIYTPSATIYVANYQTITIQYQSSGIYNIEPSTNYSWIRTA